MKQPGQCTYNNLAFVPFQERNELDRRQMISQKSLSLTVSLISHLRTLHRFKGSGHVEHLRVHPEEYQETVHHFLGEALEDL
mmetsp:Transcript_15516/g.28474  ORF Transcript_15516/g.28474 Transcript_15516/m.28474 type:complete len:82 (-) Transcript_15516:877-1122(-)